MEQKRENKQVSVVKPGRRNFLLAAGAGTVGAVAVVATKVIPEPKPAKTSGKDKGGHYPGLTEHMKRYFATTKV